MQALDRRGRAALPEPGERDVRELAALSFIGRYSTILGVASKSN
jgi:hypothetical protein